jgi:hypothetical protein
MAVLFCSRREIARFEPFVGEVRTRGERGATMTRCGGKSAAPALEIA